MEHKIFVLYMMQEYRCIFCNYAFTTYVSKTTHEAKGKCKDKKFICTKCNARFTTAGNLKKHTCGKVFECECCKRKFRTVYFFHFFQLPFSTTFWDIAENPQGILPRVVQGVQFLYPLVWRCVSPGAQGVVLHPVAVCPF